ncbi:MAG TPA: BlaI/MecI/CopY family transcriptional regulator [Acidobacteriaceae bacterium]|nr:BlaI/MecI/CopY family transcriptional regulator [Acidobacteriaceae bacterium]
MKDTGRTAAPTHLPTEAELEILNILWTSGPTTVRDVHNQISKGVGYTTVLKQMQLMVEKGLLSRTEEFRSHVYAPRIAKEQTQRRLARNLLQRAFDGSARDLVLGALSAQKVSAKELADIRRLLDDYEKGTL